MYYIDWFKTVIDELQRYKMRDGSRSANYCRMAMGFQYAIQMEYG